MLFVVSLILAFVCARKKRELEKYGRKRAVSYYFYEHSLVFLTCLLLVVIFYFVLYLLAQLASGFVNVQSLIQIEEGLMRLKSSFAVFKLDPVKVLLIYLALYFFGILGLAATVSKRLFSSVDRYRTLARVVYIVLVLLCSFTLLGTQMGQPTQALRLRIKTTREGYADLQQQVREDLTREIVKRFYDGSLASFPPAYQHALTLPALTATKTVVLKDAYAAAQTGYAVRLESVEKVLAREQAQSERASRTEAEIVLVAEAARDRVPAETVLPDTSPKKITDALSVLQSRRERLHSKVIALLEIEGGKKVVLQLPKVVTGEIKKAAFREVVAAYPILEPVVDVFVRTIDKGIEREIEASVDRLTQSAIEKPGAIEQVIQQEAARVVAPKAVAVPEAILERASAETRSLEQEYQEVERAITQVAAKVRQVEDQRVNDLIVQLRSSQETVAQRAAEQLSGMGDKLSQEQVNEIVAVMKTGNQEWRRQLRRESHCTWYEFTTTKYYAARSLQRMKSPYISPEVIAEAKQAENKEKSQRRVTDPGWI